MKDRYVIPFEELGQDDWGVVGKKCANLGEMMSIKMPVPPGFALTIECHRRFVRETGIDQEIKRYIASTFPEGLKELQQYQEASRVIYSFIESKQIPGEIREAILLAYESLCQRCSQEQVPVSVRSAGAKSHPGMYDTFLNVRSEAELIKKVVQVWASAYNIRSIAAVCQQGLPVADSPPIGIGVQRIIEARAAGVCFTINPVTGDKSRVVIESSWGMGESIVGGTVSPDRYFINKQSLEILEKTPGAKTSQVICHELGNTIEQEVPAEKQFALCLEDEEAKQIAKIATILEAHFNSPQDMEWAIDSTGCLPDNVFVLQTRPVTGVKQEVSQKSTTDTIIDLMLRRMFDH